ncbi:hypothetical protein PUN28_011917 [Cardiocondyla obscurior]|uniref:E3 ubiquitin-protein ligase Sina-like RING finger domain-containing protein n=1 Tax=Cardiocondyla obscurior TaxID=286306 RepID=A0AAW2FCI9_9HYME
MEEIRVMWCDTLEELLQCPVCLDISQVIKIQCVNGHHICNTCRMQLDTCPICKAHFIGTRNLAVEQLSAKFEDIKLSILNPYHALNRKILPNKVCVAIQTENSAMPSTSCQTEDVEQAVSKLNNLLPKPMSLAPKIGKGTYPCRIRPCKNDLPHGRMIGHLRYYHRQVYYEFIANDYMFKKQWSLEFTRNQNYDYAFHVKGMGLFFLIISINHMFDLSASLQIVNCGLVCKQFTYTLETNTGCVLYRGPVKSCRLFSPNDGLQIPGNNMRQFIDSKNCFYYNLIIKRKVDCGAANPMSLLSDVDNNDEA